MSNWRAFAATIMTVGLLAFAASRPIAAEPPPVLVEGERIEWSDLQPLMAEAVGGQIVEELALARLLKVEVERRGVRVGREEIEQERLLLGRTLAEAAGLPEGEGPELIERVRRTRGLGDLRFAALLERNAMLRALVRAGVGVPAEPTANEDDASRRVSGRITISDEDVQTAYTLKYGSRVRARLILLTSELEAREALHRLGRSDDGQPLVGPLAETFGEVAAALSLDPSRERGGLLPTFSLADANYPVAVRTALQSMTIGEVSPPLAVSWRGSGGTGGTPLQQGFAVVRLEERIAPPVDAPKLEDVREKLVAEIRMVRERSLMDKLGNTLLREARITIFDRTLGKGWDAWRGVEDK